MKANLFIIGAGKCGTTALWSYLSEHPQVTMASSKEPSYFSFDKHWKRGDNWYHSLYPNTEGKIVIGEASNSYSATGTYPKTPARLHQYNPQAKLIYIVRNPISRSESDWMELNRHTEIEFSKFLKEDKLYYDKNEYLKNYTNYLNYFKKEAILVLLFEEMTEDFAATQKKLSAFLNIDILPSENLATARRTSAQNKPSIIVTKLRTTDFFASIRRLIPQQLRSIIVKLSSRKHITTRPVWAQSDIQWFKNEFEEKSKKFLLATGFGPDKWQWDRKIFATESSNSN